MAQVGVRFLITNIKDKEVQDEYGYSIFEPTVALEVSGRNVFEDLGDSGAEPVLIMHFREGALKETLQMVRQYETLPEGEGEFDYWLDGTGCGFRLHRRGDELSIHLEVGDWGPVGNLRAGTFPVGVVTVREWVLAIVVLAKELSDKFRRLNPRTYADLQDQERQIGELQSWLTTEPH